jgi:hypothetical protein
MTRHLIYFKPEDWGFHPDSEHEYKLRVVCECDTDNFTKIFNDPNTFVEIIEFERIKHHLKPCTYIDRVRKFIFKSESPLGDEG